MAARKKPTITVLKTKKQIAAFNRAALLQMLIELLQDGVHSGASIGFLPPLLDDAAYGYWQTVLEQVGQGWRILLVAQIDKTIVGTVQLELATKPNASHRAEVQKLIVHTAYRRRGIGEALMHAVEDAARKSGRTLLLLDTRSGDAAEKLYEKLGYRRVGVFPRYARSADGELCDSVFFSREL